MDEVHPALTNHQKYMQQLCRIDYKQKRKKEQKSVYCVPKQKDILEFYKIETTTD